MGREAILQKHSLYPACQKQSAQIRRKAGLCHYLRRILYLDAYARFRQGSLDSETFALYSERYCWNITFCGAEALRVYNHDYLAQTADGKKYLLNMHIKYGVKVQELVRIYFCWDDALQKVILGYLPDHLPTLKDPT